MTTRPARYRVSSDLVAGHDRGAAVTGDDFPGCDVDALVAAGHLTPAAPAKRATRPAAATTDED